MNEVKSLRDLARLHGVQSIYEDGFDRRRSAPPESIVAVLRALGVDIDAPERAAELLRAGTDEHWRRVCEPVLVAWQGTNTAFELRLPEGEADRVRIVVALEQGGERVWDTDVGALPILRKADVDGRSYVERAMPVPPDLPLGYHELRVEAGAIRHDALLISAPRRAYEGDERKRWGVFLPLYALRTERDWGAGDLTDLEHLTQRVGDVGGDVVATLPMLAAFLDEPFDPSPYSPATRLFWNELYLDPTRAPEFERARATADELRGEIDELRAMPLVDYRRVMAAKRRVLEGCARALFADGGDRQAAFERFVREQPRVTDYARFRAATERFGTPWRAWPSPQRDGHLTEDDVDADASRYHLYVQFLLQEQLRAVGETAGARGAGLYLDMPLGVHGDGYDVWRERGSFASGVSGGSPPDRFFTAGQNWVFPPLHPQRIRADRYRYPLACIRTLLAHARVLRFDHVMALHRLFWIPEGGEPSDGMYVRYHAREWYAILALESQRRGALVIGEDLGTVPREVRTGMARHGVLRSYIVQEEFTGDDQAPLHPVPERALAGVNTHDMPTFASFWLGRDIDERIELGLLDEEGAAEERARREDRKGALTRFLRDNGYLARGGEPGARAVLDAIHEFLALSPARLATVSLEDLVLEEERQNTPGTTTERPNWRRKARVTLDDLANMDEIVERLRTIDQLRTKGVAL